MNTLSLFENLLLHRMPCFLAPARVEIIIEYVGYLLTGETYYRGSQPANFISSDSLAPDDAIRIGNSQQP